MKKNMFLLAVATLSLVGCSQNEIMETNPDTRREIGFGVYTGTQTRGLVTDNSTTNGGTVNGLKVANKGFGIMAILTGGDYTAAKKMPFMDNTHVTWQSTAWGYSPVKFWPNNATDKISFFAYAPYATADGDNGITDLSVTDASNSNPKLTFELQNNQKDMVDLVVSEAKTGTDGTINQTSTTNTSAVGFNFKHMLSRVSMKAKTSVDIVSNPLIKVYVTAVSIEHNNKLFSKATLDMYTHKWAATQTAAYLPTSYTLNKAASNGILNLTSISFGNLSNSDAIDISTNSTGVSLFPDNQYLFFIPVNNGVGTAAEGDVSVKIKYDIVTKSSAAGNEVSLSTDTKTAKLPKGAFKLGKAYEYIFTVTLNEIKVDVTAVEGWTTESTNPLPLQ